MQKVKMKKLNLQFVVISLVIFLTSCGTTKQLTSDLKPKEINKILILKPFARIDLIGKDNKSEYSQENSEQVMSSILESVEKHIPARIVRQKLEIDSLEQYAVYKEIYNLAMTVEQNTKIKGITLNDKMIELLEKNNHNYAIGVLNFGFSRSKGNYGKEVAKGIGVGILTLGLYTPVPIKSYSTIICFIIDKKNRNIAFYRKNLGQERDPTKKEVIDSQIGDMLNQYFQIVTKNYSDY